jgi:hypothetical protein
VTRADGGDDDATRTIHAGDPVFLHIDWFERFSWDGTKADRRGKPIHHGVRACAFGPDGRKIASVETVSGSTGSYALIDRGRATEPGTYHVAACTVGDVGEEKAPFGEGRTCAWTVLEYEFKVEP